MTTGKSFKKCAIAFTISSLFAATSSIATPAQAIAPSMAETTAKLQNQTGFETQFIIKYKNNTNDLASFAATDTDYTKIQTRTQLNMFDKCNNSSMSQPDNQC